MGVQVTLTVYAPHREAADGACRAAFARLAELEDVMSDYRPASELSRLSDAAGGPPVQVSEDLFTVLACAYDLAERSGGAFDATVGPYVQLWRRAKRSGTLPPAEEWQAAGRLVGYRRVRLNADARTVRLTRAGMRLDLGGIAKGHALDAALATLRAHGLPRAMAAAGGDIALGDPPPDRPGWRLVTRKPGTGAGKLGTGTRFGRTSCPKRVPVPNFPAPVPDLQLSNCGVSTSGDTEQFVEIGGRRFSHILDPRSGLRRATPLLASVIAPNATTSDALATACVVLGEERARRLVETVPGASLYLHRPNP